MGNVVVRNDSTSTRPSNPGPTRDNLSEQIRDHVKEKVQRKLRSRVGRFDTDEERRRPRHCCRAQSRRSNLPAVLSRTEPAQSTANSVSIQSNTSMNNLFTFDRNNLGGRSVGHMHSTPSAPLWESTNPAPFDRNTVPTARGPAHNPSHVRRIDHSRDSSARNNAPVGLGRNEYDVARTIQESYDQTGNHSRNTTHLHRNRRPGSQESSPASNNSHRQNTNDAAQNEDASKCKVCLDASLAVVFQPCRHLVCCVECSQQVQECPLCRGTITGRMQVYM